VAVRSVGGTGAGRSSAAAPKRARAKPPGPVLKAARKSFADIDSDHPAAGLLVAAAERLARDVDEAPEVRDRVAAVRAVLDLVKELDVGPPPPLPGGPALEDDEDEDGDGKAVGARDDPFDIGDLPPGLGDAEAS
jgi:hypothetical protein